MPLQGEERSMGMKIAQALGGFGAGVAGRGLEYTQGLEKQRQMALVQDAHTARQFLLNNDIDSATNLLVDRVNNIESLGGDPSDTLQLLNKVQSGDIAGSIADLSIPIEYAASQGLFKLPQVEDGTVEVRKELRSDLKKQRKSLLDGAQETLNNYRKLQSLGKEVKKGNRSAAAQLGVTLVKLGDASSVVKEEELRQAFAAVDPAAAIGQLVADGKMSQSMGDTLATALDPLNPNVINVDNILATGQSMVNSAVPNWMDRYGQMEEQGQLLTEFGRKSIFSEKMGKIRDDMQSLVKESTSRVTSQQIQNIANKTGKSVEQVTQDLKAKGLL